MPNIEADELKVREIIYNLLSNSVKYTPEGGKIGIRAKKVDSADRSSGLGYGSPVLQLKTWRKYLKDFSVSIPHFPG